MTDEQNLAKARKRAKAKVEFYIHLVIYVVVIGMLLGINLIAWSGYFWVIWPAFFWGIALFLHGANAFLISQKEAMIDRIAKREAEKPASQTHG